MCKDEILGIDFTSDNISSIREMILLIKTTRGNHNIKNILKYLCYKFDNLRKTKKKDSHKNKIDLFENDYKKVSNNIGEKNINFINNNNINGNNKCNFYNNLLNLLNINQMNNCPFNYNILFNNNTNNKNISDCQKSLNNFYLTNNLIDNNNKSYINNPFIMSIIDKIIFLLRLKYSNIINDIDYSLNNIFNAYLNSGINTSISNDNGGSQFNPILNVLNLNLNNNNNLNNLSNILLGIDLQMKFVLWVSLIEIKDFIFFTGFTFR